MRPSLSPFAAIRYCRWTIASTLCSQRFRTSRGLPCIAVFNGTASLVCRKQTATSPRGRSSSGEPIGFFHIDIAELRTAEGKLYLFVAIDRTSKFAVAQLVEKADRKTAWEFLEHFLDAVPYRIHTILTDNGIQFAEQPRNRNTIISRPMRFDMINARRMGSSIG